MKNTAESIVIRKMEMNEVKEDILRNFTRYHEVKTVCYFEEDKLKFIDHPFVDEWDDDEKKNIIGEMHHAIESGGVLFGAFYGNRLIGFASVDGHKIGPEQNYRQMHLLYVSCEYQGYGLGRNLFEKCVDYGVENQVGKLYISSHCSYETVMFYQGMGCVKAEWIYQKQVDLEPYDCQLEYKITKDV